MFWSAVASSTVASTTIETPAGLASAAPTYQQQHTKPLRSISRNWQINNAAFKARQLALVREQQEQQELKQLELREVEETAAITTAAAAAAAAATASDSRQNKTMCNKMKKLSPTLSLPLFSSPLDIPRKLSRLLTCALCQRIYYPNNPARQPKELICRHIYCASCVEKLPGSLSITCPECGKSTPLPALGALNSHEGLVFLLQQLPALNLGMTMLAQQEEQELQLSGFNNSRTPWPNWLNELVVARYVRGDSTQCVEHETPSSTWCRTCQKLVCTVCPLNDHYGHNMSRHLNPSELMRTLIVTEMNNIEAEINNATALAATDMAQLRHLCDACDAMQQHLKQQIVQHAPTLRISFMREWFTAANLQIQQHGFVPGWLTTSQLMRLLKELYAQHAKFQKLILYNYSECRLRASVREGGLKLLDFGQLNRRLLKVRQMPIETTPSIAEPPPALLLTNYCVYAYWWNMQREIIQYEEQKEEELEEYQLESMIPLPNTSINNFYTLWEESAISSSSSSEASNKSSPVSGNNKDKSCPAAKQPPPEYKQPQKTTSTQMPKVKKTPSEIVRPQQTPPKPKSKWPPTKQVTTVMRPQSTKQKNVNIAMPPSGFNYDLASTSSAAVVAAAAMVAAASVAAAAPALPPVGSPISVSGAATPRVRPGGRALPLAPAGPILLNHLPSPRGYPIYFLDMEMAGKPAGRILIEVRNDVAPRMAENFRALITHERGYGYKGCIVFQAWNNESVSTGDFELQNGRGGYSALKDRFFMPDSTRLLALRGTVGMRRGQKRYDNRGFVGSQFRLVINEMRTFTAIFGFIVDGIEILDNLASMGDANGRPTKYAFIKDCGEYRRNTR